MDRTQQQVISRIVLFTVFVITALIITQPGMGKTEQRITPINVESLQVTCGSHAKMIKLYGKVLPTSPSNVDSRITANVKAIHSKTGDTVKQGEPLLEFNSEKLLQQHIALKHTVHQIEQRIVATEKSLEAEQQLLTNEAALLKRAQDELQRYESLSPSYKNKSTLKAYQDAVNIRQKQVLAHQNQVETLSHQIESEKSAMSIRLTDLAQIEIDLDHTNVVAPIDGIIQQQLIETGDFATPGTPLFIISDPRLIHVNVFVPAQYLPQLHTNQSKAYLDDPEMTPLTLKRISQLIEDGSAHIDAQYHFDEDQPKIALGHTISILAEISLSVDTCPVPESSIYNGKTIYRIDNEQLQSVEITDLGLTYQQGKPFHLITSAQPIDNQYILTTRLSSPKTGTRVSHE